MIRRIFLEAGLTNVQINQGKMFKNTRSILIWHSWRICDAYTITCILISTEVNMHLHFRGPLTLIPLGILAPSPVVFFAVHLQTDWNFMFKLHDFFLSSPSPAYFDIMIHPGRDM